MAKISAYGEHKIAEVRFHRPDLRLDWWDGSEATYTWVLTSGGRVLERVTIPHGDSSPTRSGYKLVARIKNASRRNAETLRRAVQIRGWEIVA